MDVKILANWIVQRCIDAGNPVSPQRLQRILFCVEREHIREHDQPAFFNPIEAWEDGPVVPEVWIKYAHFGTMPITVAMGEGRLDPSLDRMLIERVVDEKAGMRRVDLMQEICAPDGAWGRNFYVGRHMLIMPSEIRRWDAGRTD